ncbi:Retinol dehydrogenase 11 [Pseudolycoriella hygida]|uniref:Retinol dehydrogenase 11 n=1 Tax=Pseudolycoriella hygida TaxID=35572 RepID=A0A9Q0MYU5_9DIPT|nr:Retinol dehydrogenase 11 [Pseudolycoriella hygida]
MLRESRSKYFAAFFFGVHIVANLNIHSVYSQRLCDNRYLNDKIRIDGKVVIVTGGSGGLGLEAARNLAERGGKIYIASRSEEKGHEAAKIVRQSTGNDNVQFIKLDLASFNSIRNFSETFRRIENRLDILINNAGTASNFERTEDGLEMNMGVNHLGHFLLTNLLLDILKASAPSRIVVVTSLIHHIGLIFRDNLNSEIFFPGIVKAYSNSKLANVLFTKELSKRLDTSLVTVNCLDPGFSMSALAQHMPSLFRKFIQFLQQHFGRNPENATQTYIMLAVDPSVNNVSGKYFKDCIEEEPSDLAKNEIMAHWFWDDSVKLTKLDKHQFLSNI